MLHSNSIPLKCGKHRGPIPGQGQGRLALKLFGTQTVPAVSVRPGKPKRRDRGPSVSHGSVLFGFVRVFHMDDRNVISRLLLQILYDFLRCVLSGILLRFVFFP